MDDEAREAPRMVTLEFPPTRIVSQPEMAIERLRAIHQMSPNNPLALYQIVGELIDIVGALATGARIRSVG